MIVPLDCVGSRKFELLKCIHTKSQRETNTWALTHNRVYYDVIHVYTCTYTIPTSCKFFTYQQGNWTLIILLKLLIKEEFKTLLGKLQTLKPSNMSTLTSIKPNIGWHYFKLVHNPPSPSLTIHSWQHANCTGVGLGQGKQIFTSLTWMAFPLIEEHMWCGF